MVVKTPSRRRNEKNEFGSLVKRPPTYVTAIIDARRRRTAGVGWGAYGVRRVKRGKDTVF